MKVNILMPRLRYFDTVSTEEEKQRLMKEVTCSTSSGSAKNITAHQ